MLTQHVMHRPPLLQLYLRQHSLVKLPHQQHQRQQHLHSKPRQHLQLPSQHQHQCWPHHLLPPLQPVPLLLSPLAPPVHPLCHQCLKHLLHRSVLRCMFVCLRAHTCECMPSYYIPNPLQPLQLHFCPATQDLCRAAPLLACLYRHGALQMPCILS